MERTIFWIIIFILVVKYILEQWLEYINIKYSSKSIPDELKDIYDNEKYLKQQNYNRENFFLSFYNETFSLIVILLVLFYNGFALLYSFTTSLTDNTVLQTLVFFGIIGLISDIINTPFSLYSIFVIEEKYGFNKYTLKTYLADKIKSWILTAIIGGLLLSTIVVFYQKTLQNFWIFSWIFLTVFILFFTMFYSSLIVPLFNKQTPLEEGELREKIEEFASKVGFKLDNIYVIDGSKRSTKANAYFTGFGPKKRIVLFDTLINSLSVNEIVAVLAHEIGHYKRKHVIKSMIISILNIGLMLYLLSLFISSPLLSGALGVKTPTFAIGLIAFSLLYTPISLITGLFFNAYSRKNEYEADNFAKEYYEGKYLISALKKLAADHLTNLNPHPLYVVFYYSHPPLRDRIKNLM